MKHKSYFTFCILTVFGCIVLQLIIGSTVTGRAATILENSAGTFNGTYTNLQYNGTLGGVALQTGQNTGDYVSQIYNGGSPDAKWNELKYSTNVPIWKELPDNMAVETAYSSGNIDMSSNLALYHFNEANGVTGGVDSSGNNFNLTTSVQVGRTSAAVYRNAAQFNNQAGQVFTGPVGIGSTGRSRFTVSAWIRIDSLASGNQFIFYESVNGSTSRARIGFYVTNTARLGFTSHINDTVTTPTFNIVSSTALPVGGAFAHVAGVFDGANGQASIFINGVQSGSATFATNTTLPGTTPSFLPRLGINNSGNANNKLRAKMDEFASFSSALSAGTITNIFNRGAFRVAMQARTCSDNTCSTSNFIGPGGGTGGTGSFHPPLATSTPPETFALNSTFFPDNQYFQFRIFFEPNQGITSLGFSPAVLYVEIDYTPGSQPDPEIAFDIRNSADTGGFGGCALGQITTAVTANCSYRLKVTSANLTGYSIFAQTSGGLTNGSNSIINAASGPTGSIINNTTLGTERYGVNITPGSITSGTISAQNPFSSSNSVNFSHTTPQTIIIATGNNQPGVTDTANTSLITHSLNISSSTNPGNFTQTITYTVVPNY